jgi:capsular polysaccharide biosynthesis protein
MEELDIRQIFTYLRRHIWLIVCFVLAAGSLALTITFFFITPQYEASSTLYVYNDSDRSETSISSSDITTSQKLIATYSVIMQSNNVVNKVIEATGLDYSAEEIRKMFTGASVNSTEVMKITIKCSDPHDAMIIANAFVDCGPEEILRVIKAGSVEILDRATVPVSPSSPSIIKNLAIGIVLGLIAAVAFVILFETFNTKIRTEDNLLRVVKVPVIGYIPDLKLYQDEETEANVYGRSTKA